MKSRIRVTGMSAVRTELRTIAERVPDTARKTMHRSSARIVEEARNNAPEDVGNLVKGIQIIKDYAGLNGRLQIDVGITMPPDSFSQSGTPLSSTQFDRYVAYVHEHYEDMQPGPRTRQKMASNPDRTIGSGFLTRAAEKEAPKLEAKTIQAVTKVIEEVQR